MEQLKLHTIGNKGLTGFQLKYIALILMVLDHIQYFFEFTGVIPIWFSMLGRLSAPLFLFCLIEGFSYTHNRKKYFLQIYVLAIVMGIIQFCFMSLGLQRPDGFYPQNQMMATFTILLVILQGFDWCVKKKWVKGLLAIIIPVTYPFLVMAIGNQYPFSWLYINIMHYTILPIHFWIMDGGTFFILQGVLLYLLRKNRKWQVAIFAISNIVIYAIRPLLLVPDITIKMLFTVAYEWMGVFAIIFMLLYNGEKGTGNKKLFYLFYPVHIYVLCALSFITYYIINQ